MMIIETSPSGLSGGRFNARASVVRWVGVTDLIYAGRNCRPRCSL